VISLLKNVKKSVYFLFFITAGFVFGQNYRIDYCGVFSSEIDSNMSKITSDLYYTQLNEIQDFTVTDKRKDFSELKTTDNLTFSEDISFYVTISKNSSTEKWISTYYLHDGKTLNTLSKSKEFDSYYKILMEPKDILQSTIQDLVKTNTQSDITPAESEDSKKSIQLGSTEFLSGTWKGEDFINKIVIMKGGRGFVIFNNGASMNVLVKLKNSDGNQQITITQNQRSNASYFPELPRQQAMESAVSAEPIEWTLIALNTNTLTGKKRTLVKNSDLIDYGTIPVTWTRIN